MLFEMQWGGGDPFGWLRTRRALDNEADALAIVGMSGPKCQGMGVDLVITPSEGRAEDAAG